jgi:hypothetical protein
VSVYYQFPLSLLAFGANPEERMEVITSYCAVTLGKAAMVRHEYSPEQEVAGFPEARRPRDFQLSNPAHVALVLGFKILELSSGNAMKIISQHKKAAQFINTFESQFGPSPLVRVRGDLVWETINKEFAWRTFCVLCGVYSAIGASEKPVQITRDTIRARALGYKKASILFDSTGEVSAEGEAMLSVRPDGARPLSVNQLRYTLDHAENCGFFSRCQVTKRCTFFSHRMTSKEMRNFFRKNPPPTKRASNRAASNRALDAELRRDLKAAPIKVGNDPIKVGNDPIKVGNDSGGSPQNHHNVTTTATTGIPTTATTTVPTVIEASNRNPSNKSLSILAGSSPDDEQRKREAVEFAKAAREAAG